MHSFTSMAEDSNQFLDRDEEKNIFHDFDIDVLDSIYHQVLSYASEKEKIIICYDYC